MNVGAYSLIGTIGTDSMGYSHNYLLAHGNGLNGPYIHACMHAKAKAPSTPTAGIR